MIRARYEQKMRERVWFALYEPDEMRCAGQAQTYIVDGPLHLIV